MARAKADPKPAADQSIADVIAGLETTKAGLEARIPALEAAKADALAKRREALISGSAPAEPNKAAREADDDLAAVADALTEVGRRISAAESQREAEQDQASRNALADRLEADAAILADRAMEMHTAVEALRVAHTRFRFAVSGLASANSDPHEHDQLSPSDLAERLLKRALADAFPRLEIRGDYGSLLEGEPISPLATTLSTNLRNLAAGVRAGAEIAVRLEVTETEPTFEARRPERSIWVAEPVSYQTDRGERSISVGHQSLHSALAGHLLQHGVATVEKPANWGKRQHDVRGPTRDEYVSIPFNLSEWERADIAEQRAAWLAERAAERSAVMADAA